MFILSNVISYGSIYFFLFFSFYRKNSNAITTKLKNCFHLHVFHVVDEISNYHPLQRNRRIHSRGRLFDNHVPKVGSYLRRAHI